MRIKTLMTGLIALSLSAGVATAQEPVPAPTEAPKAGKATISKAKRLEGIKAAHDAQLEARRQGRVIDEKIKRAQQKAKEDYKSAARKGPKLNPLPGVKKPSKRDFEGEREGRMRPTKAVPTLKQPLPGRVKLRPKLPSKIQPLPKSLPRVRGGGVAIPKRPIRSKKASGGVTFKRNALVTNSKGLSRVDLAKQSQMRVAIENRKHATRLVQLDRLAEVAKDNNDKALLTQVNKMRAMELARFKKATGK